MIGQGKGRNARKRKKREEEERRKREEEEALLQNTDKTIGDQNKVHHEENDKSKEEVKGAVIREPMNRGLVEFIDRQILDLEEELECPVCLEVASNPPIFKCVDDHLICSACRPKVGKCPQCRVDFGDGLKRFRGAERQAERLMALRLEKIKIDDGSSQCETIPS